MDYIQTLKDIILIFSFLGSLISFYRFYLEFTNIKFDIVTNHYAYEDFNLPSSTNFIKIIIKGVIHNKSIYPISITSWNLITIDGKNVEKHTTNFRLLTINGMTSSDINVEYIIEDLKIEKNKIIVRFNIETTRKKVLLQKESEKMGV